MTGRNPKPNGNKAQSGRALVWFKALNPADGTPPPLGKMGRKVQELIDVPVAHRAIETYHALSEVAR